MTNHSKKEVKDLLLLFIIALLLTSGIFVVDEAKYSFDFLLKPKEIVHLITFTFFFSIFPIGIYSLVSQSTYKRRALVISTIGYVPVIFIYCLPRIF